MSDKPGAQDLREKLKSELDTAEWTWVKPHLERDAVILVDQDLDLLDVGCIVAEGRMDQVEKWMTEQQLTKPTRDQIRVWDNDQRRPFLFLIIQPWVFIQQKGN